jgi:hypothetical protein
MPLARFAIALGSLFAHDLFGKPLHTFPDHALVRDNLAPEPLKCGEFEVPVSFAATSS